MLALALVFCALTLGFCAFAGRVGVRLGVIDHPDANRKRHRRPTPLVGGIALMVPLVLVALHEAWAAPVFAHTFLGLAVAAGSFAALGWFDDRNEAPPTARLVISVGLGAMIVLMDPALRLTQIEVLSLSVPLGLFAIPLTVLCLVGLQNAINMADGLNGLVIGLSIFWTICLLIHAPPYLIPFLSFLLLGLFILLPYNLAGRLFLGDAGSYSLAVVIGLLMIVVYREAAGRLPMLTVALWLAIPVLDCLRVSFTRMMAGRSPMLGDRNHLHHRLSANWPWPTSVLAYLSLAAGPGLCAAIWPEMTPAMAIFAIAGYAAIIRLTRSTSEDPVTSRA